MSGNLQACHSQSSSTPCATGVQNKSNFALGHEAYLKTGSAASPLPVWELVTLVAVLPCKTAWMQGSATGTRS